MRPHPLFLLAGAVSALLGQFLVFLAVTLAALEHECAHAFAARRFGYSLDAVVLMPYGAVISGDIGGIPPKQELWVCLAGPLANAATGLLFVALWWLYPPAYPYTDVAAYASFSLFFVNLLPAFPLDGGRILRIALRPLGERRALLSVRIVTGIVAAGLLALFVVSCFFAPNFGALAFSVLLLAGCFGGGTYQRAPILRKDFSRGVEERRVAVDGALPLGGAMRFLREDRHLVLVVMEGGEFAGELTEEELLAALGQGDYGKPLREVL